MATVSMMLEKIAKASRAYKPGAASREVAGKGWPENHDDL